MFKKKKAIYTRVKKKKKKIHKFIRENNENNIKDKYRLYDFRLSSNTEYSSVFIHRIVV